MALDSWHEARLIPTSGINGVEEQERRATSALLAVMTAVREFGRALTQPLGAPAGHIRTFIEVQFKLADKVVIPDGVIEIVRGQRSWTALVEVKTGDNALRAEQLENYLDVAREQGFDAVLTISNEIPPIAGQHPTKVDKRKLRKVALYHLSWSQILFSAVLQKEVRGVADPDQSWILGELIRYLEHPRSGALEFNDMGANWVLVRDAVRAGTLRASDPGAADVASRFDALLRFTSLALGRKLGAEVTPALSRKDLTDPAARTGALAAELAASGTLRGAIRIPGAVGPVNVCADLRAGTIVCHVDVDAPSQGRATTRVNWLVRQLKEAPDSVRIEARVAHQRGAGATALLGAVRADASLLIDDATRELKSFQIAASSALGTKRGQGRGAFIDSLLEAVDEFYDQVLQQLRAWAAAPPKLRGEAESALASEQPGVRPDLVSTALSSQDDSEPA